MSMRVALSVSMGVMMSMIICRSRRCRFHARLFLFFQLVHNLEIGHFGGFGMATMGSVTVNGDAFLVTRSPMPTVDILDAVKETVMTAMGSVPVKDLPISINGERSSGGKGDYCT